MSDSTPSKEDRMQPVIILPPGAMTKADIKVMRENHFCVVEAKDPSAVRFIEPPPMGYSAQERAAISLCRHILNTDGQHFTRGQICEWLVHFVMQGSPLAPVERAKKVTS